MWLSTIAAVAVIVVTPLIGSLSDRFGRKPLLVGLCVGSAVLPVTMFSLMAGSGAAAALAGAVVLAMLAGGVSAVGAVATAEQFPGEGRITGLALGATMATAVFGGLTPYCCPTAGRANGLAHCPRNHDRLGRAVRRAGAPDDARNGADR